MSTLVQGGIGIALGVDGTQAVQLSASSRKLPAQFGHLTLQPALGGHQFGAALADGFHQKQTRLRLHRLGARTYKIAINSYPIQRPLWTTLRTSSRTSRDVREVP